MRAPAANVRDLHAPHRSASSRQLAFQLNGSRERKTEVVGGELGPGFTLGGGRARVELHRARVAAHQHAGHRQAGDAWRIQYLVGDLLSAPIDHCRASVAFTPTLTVRHTRSRSSAPGDSCARGNLNPLARRVTDRVRFFGPTDVAPSVDGDEVTYRTSGGDVTIDNPDFSVAK